MVATIPGSATLELSGYTPGAHLAVEAKRGTTVIGTAATDVATDGSAGVNPVACWAGSFSPQLLPGDTITVSGDGPVDTATVNDVGATSLQIDPVSGNILVHGFARTPAGAGLDATTFAASVQARITAARGSQFSNGRLALRAGAGKFDGTVAQDAPGSVTWTATFPPKLNDAAIAQSAKDFEGVYLIGLSELTIGRTPVAAPAAGCGPIQQNGVSSFDRTAINAANAATPLVINGVAQADATSATVAVTDANGKSAPGSPFTATVSNGLFKITGVDVSGLADGTVTVTSTITTPTQTFAGATQTLEKDTVVPRAPVASPGNGTTFIGPKTVSLGDDDTTAKIHYTTVGSAPGPGSAVFATPITVDHSLRIRAVAIDAAGNVSPEGSFAYTVLAPPTATTPSTPLGPVGGGGAGAGTPTGATNTTIIQQIPLLLPVAPAAAVAGNRASSPARPAVQGLSVAVLRGHALRVGMRLDRGAGVVRLRVFRARGGRPTGSPLLSVLRLPVGSGRFVVTLHSRALRAGTYVLEARAGASRGALGASALRTFRVH